MSAITVAGACQFGRIVGQHVSVGWSTDLSELRLAEFNYDEVGATAEKLPAGYRHFQRSRDIGHGHTRFESAATALLSWQVHRRAGLQVRSPASVVTADEPALLLLGRRPVAIAAPVRVIYLIDEARRQGFAYGTLAGHPESGEEAFTVSLAEDDTVTFAVTAFSRPASKLARLAPPVSSTIQDWVTNRYLRSI
ncbi:DUF1990 family protein [Angustibacter sp. McL0619]|uniref:DUF1990 family protein n=1 Tax=Angustibacter sp. McL0619 TaxID=3415676 RepID=UPI003CF2552E